MALKEITIGREISTTKEGNTTTLAEALIQVKITTTTGTAATIIQEENVLIKDMIVTTTLETSIKEGITAIIPGTILMVATAIIQVARATINVILILNMNSLSTRKPTALINLNTSAPVRTFYSNIPIHRQDSITLPADQTSSVKCIVRWRKTTVAQRDGRNSTIWTFSRTTAMHAQDPSRRAIDLT